MKSTQELFRERVNRIQTAVALGTPDRIPVVISNDMFAPAHMGVKLSDYVKDFALCNKTIIDSAVELQVDGLQITCIDPNILSTLWFTKIKMPGVDLPENSLWQAHEAELMTVDDYDVIINKGWNYFTQDFFKNRLDNLMEKLAPFFQYMPTAIQNTIAAGIVPYSGATLVPPFEMICGARSMAKFMVDLYKIPDKIQAAFDAAMVDILANSKMLLANKPLAAWVGGWRGNGGALNKKLWNRFVWPYMKKLAEVTLEAGVIPTFHVDSDWSRDLEYFRELPKGKCVFYPDGMTNIFKIKEVLGDHMCINGDVPPALLSIGTPEEVYNYSRKLINEIGPSGFILGQGCDIPYNAKVDNVKAMVSAALDS